VSVSVSVVWIVAMTSPRITYTPRPDATPEAELSALASVYRFIIDSHANTNAAGVSSTNGDDAERSLSDSASNDSTA
jgi:hypothetical protein